MRKFLLACSCVFVAMGYAQTTCDIQFTGIILDKHDLQPVPYAKIQVKGKNIGAIADTNGRFIISGLCEGRYDFICLHHMGCKPVRFEREIRQSFRDTLIIEFHLYELEETHVVAHVFDLSNLSKVKPNAPDQLLGLGKNLGDQLKQLPGVSSLNTGPSISKPIIHGMYGNRIVLLNNGVRQEGQQWGSEHAPELDPFISSELAVVKGASTIRYGSDALGGVILADPPGWKKVNGLQGQWMNVLASNGRSAGSSLKLEGNTPIKNLQFRLHGTFKKAGTVQAPDYYIANTALRETNFSAAAHYQYKKWESEFFYTQFNTQLGIFSGAHIGNLSDLEMAFQAQKPLDSGYFTYHIQRPSQQINHELSKWQNRIVFNKNHELSMLISRQYNQRQEFDKHLTEKEKTEGLNVPAFKFKLTSWQAEVKWEHRWNAKWSGETGLSSQYQKNTWQGRFFIPNFQRMSAGLYWIENYKHHNNEWEVGLRADQINMQVYQLIGEQVEQNDHQFGNLSASIGYNRLFGHHLHIHANLASAWRAPQVNELYSYGLHHGAAAIEIGRSDLKKESSINAQTGFTYKSNRLTMQADVWTSFFDGFIYLNPEQEAQLTIKGAFPVFTYQQSKATLNGFDLYLHYKPIQWLQFQWKASVVRAINPDNRTFLPGIPADRTEPGLLSAFKAAKGEWTLGIFVPLVAKQWRYESESDYVAPPPAYVLLNALISYQFNWKKQKLTLSLEGNNLFNRNYRDYLNRFRYFTNESGRNIYFKLIIPFKIK